MPEYKNLCMGCMIDKGENEVCPKCGFGENDLQPLSNLPLRYLLDGRYLIGRSLESNSESVTYLAWDTEENIAVRVHEYFPEAFCDRAADGIQVTPFAGKEFEYNKYIEQFLDIARTLAKNSDLPSLFPVTDIFEANETAYYVTDHVKTITMREFLIRNGGTLTWDQIRPLLMPVLTTLSALHEDDLIHRGISPETLIVGVDGKIRISGFCVADVRTARTEINAQLFPGFAAIEQYGFENSQGPWTDVYGLCATLYRVLVGSPPADATERVTNDRMVIPSEIAREIPRNVLTALADGLAILADDRTRNVAELKNELVPSSGDPDAPVSSGKGRKYAIIAAVITLVILVGLGYYVFKIWGEPLLNQTTDVSSNASVPTSSVVSQIEAPVNPDATYPVDNLIGMPYTDAVTLASANFEIRVIDVAMSNYDYGKIFWQSINPGEKQRKGTVIEVKISVGNGMLAIPQGLIGQTVDVVYQALRDAGFRVDHVKLDEMVSEEEENPGIVIEIDPECGTNTSMFSVVTIYKTPGDPVTSEETSSEESEPTSSETAAAPSGTTNKSTSSPSTSSQ